MAKKIVEHHKSGPAHEPDQEGPKVDLVAKGGGSLFTVALPSPAISLVIEAPSRADAIEAYNHFAGVITTEQQYQVTEFAKAS